MAVGFAVTGFPVEGDTVVPGTDVSVDAPLAVNVDEFPAHIVAESTVTVGNGFTVSIPVALAVQLPAVPTTVYIVVDVGFAITVAVVVELSPVEGLHT